MPYISAPRPPDVGTIVKSGQGGACGDSKIFSFSLTWAYFYFLRKAYRPLLVVCVPGVDIRDNRLTLDVGSNDCPTW